MNISHTFGILYKQIHKESTIDGNSAIFLPWKMSFFFVCGSKTTWDPKTWDPSIRGPKSGSFVVGSLIFKDDMQGNRL